MLADLRDTSPELILHGGDLADSGSSPVEIIDQIRDLGCLALPETRTKCSSIRSRSLRLRRSPHLQPLFDVIEEMAAATRERLGAERLEWLRGLPHLHIHGPVALVHASPASAWHAPAVDASGAALESMYVPLGQPVAVHGHIHRPYIRRTPP